MIDRKGYEMNANELADAMMGARKND